MSPRLEVERAGVNFCHLLKSVAETANVKVTAELFAQIVARINEGAASVFFFRVAHEVRGEAEYFADIPKLELPKELLELAEYIIKTKTADFDVAWLEDRYRTALVSMLREKKRAALPSKTTPTKPSPRNVISLMDALQQSLKGKASAKGKASTKRAAHSSSRRAAHRTRKKAHRSAARARKAS